MSIPDIAGVLAEVRRIRDAGESAAIVTVISAPASSSLRPGARVVVTEDAAVAVLADTQLDVLVREDGAAAIRERKSQMRSYRMEEAGTTRARPQKGNLDLYFEVLSRPPRMVIVGAGHIAVPLARLGRLLDFHVIVLDDRPEYASAERFPEADEILVGPYRETLAGVTVDSDTYIVLVTRGHVHDQACLEQVLDSAAPYVGMIGSKRRVQTVMARIKSEGATTGRLARVYAPVGIDIGSQTPAEIALAIAAEIVNVRRGGRAPSLGLKERLHV